MALTRVELENFTAFRSLRLDLCPGINVLGLRIAGSAPRCQFFDLYNFENCAITVA